MRETGSEPPARMGRENVNNYETADDSMVLFIREYDVEGMLICEYPEARLTMTDLIMAIVDGFRRPNSPLHRVIVREADGTLLGNWYRGPELGNLWWNLPAGVIADIEDNYRVATLRRRAALSELLTDAIRRADTLARLDAALARL